MRVKSRPKQHQVENKVEKIDSYNDELSSSTSISRSEPCLRFNDNFDPIMHQINTENHQVFPEFGPSLDEALDLAMPTRSRCKHEHYKSCFSLTGDFGHGVSDDNLEAIDLSMKGQRQAVKLDNSPPRPEVKGTFLYKMLTDPSFLENLRGIKKSPSYDCPFCKRKFSKEEDLTDHQNVRKDESNQVACCACGKTFAQKRYLRYHQRCHSERSKFTCEICTKNYSRLDNLTRHNTFHTNPDKYPCTACERTFARKDLLKKHIKCHENRHRYHCSICDKYFKGPLSLEKHEKLFHANA